jgi:hypothetical protein
MIACAQSENAIPKKRFKILGVYARSSSSAGKGKKHHMTMKISKASVSLNIVIRSPKRRLRR